jgi:hypothetical protein
MIKIPKIKLQWAAASQTPGEWRLGLFGRYQRKSGRGTGLAVSVRGLICWGFLAATLAYFVGAGYVWWKLERNPYNFVRYTDILLYPVKRKEISELRGKALIAEGMDDLKAQKWREGVMKLRIGLDKFPRDLKARLEIAKFFLAAKVRPKAQEMLVGGLDYGWPGRYFLESAVSVATAGEDQELIIELCDRALALHDPSRHSAADRRWVVETRIRALLAEGRSDDALALTEKESATLDTDTLSEFRLLALFQAKRAVEAVSFAEDWRKRAGDTPRILRLLARAYREAERKEDMFETLDVLRDNEPSDPRTHVFAMIQIFMAGDEVRGRALLDDYIFRFGGTPANFSLAAEPLGEIGQLAALDVLLAEARDRGLRDLRLAAARLDALITARRWTDATQQITDIRASMPANMLGRASLLDLMQFLIAAASDPADGAQSSLSDYVRNLQLPMSAYRRCVEVLRESGRTTTAQEIVNFAQGVFPANKYLSDTRTALAREIKEQEAALAATKPAAAAAPVFATADKFYAKLDETVKKNGYEAGLTLIREVLKSKPSWALNESEPLARRELELQTLGDDVVALQAAARRYLNNDRVRIQKTITIATGLFEAKRPEDARIVLAEVLKIVPDDARATRLMKTWFPPKPAATSATSTDSSPAVPTPVQ